MSLRQTAVSGVKWTSAARGVTYALRLIQLAVMARLLSPGDFGLMGMISAVLALLTSVADLGVSNAVVIRQDASREQLSSLYWLNFVLGIFLYAALVAATPLVVLFYHEPRLTGLIYLAALSLLIVPIGQQFQMLLQKELRFDRMAVVDMATALGATAVAIGAAIRGAGVYSLVLGHLTSSALRSILLVGYGLKTWRPSLRLRLEDVRSFLGFGLYQMGERILNYLSANMDYVMVGRYLGKDALGIYTLAYEAVVTPLASINPALNAVVFPLFARRQTENAALSRGFCEVTRVLAVVVFPLLLGLGVTAPILIPLVFGPNWMSSIVLIQILVPLGVLKTLANPVGTIYLVKGRADIAFLWTAVYSLAAIVAFRLAVGYGVLGVAICHTALVCLFIIPSRLILYRLIDLQFRDDLSAFLKPTLTALAMAGVVEGVYLELVGHVSNRLALLVALVLLGGFTYGGLSLRFQRATFVELYRILVSRRREAKACPG